MKHKIFVLSAVFAFMAFVALPGKAQDSGIAVGATLEDFTLTGIDGKERSFKGLMGKNGAVIVFLSAQCPVVKAYNDRINQIAASYADKGIAFIGINSNSTESLEWVTSDATEVGYKFPLLIDKGNVLADRLGATVTPEVYFFNTKSVLLYHGAIDNDRSGRNIQEQYLTTAFDTALNGGTVEKTRTNAFGCEIKRVSAAGK